MVNLDEDPNPTINLDIKITNHSENTAANARLSVYTIAGTLIYQTCAAVNLNKDESAEIPVTFTLPTLEESHMGIGYTLYQLEDAAGQVIRMERETPGGRFALYKPIEPAGIDGGLFQWITVKSETVYYGQELECRIHLKNETDLTKQLDFDNPYFLIGHGSLSIPLDSFSVTLAPGESQEQTVYLPTGRLDPEYNGMVTFQIRYHTPDGETKRIGAKKGIFLKNSWLKSSLALNSPARMAPGGSFDYSAAARADAPMDGETSIRLVLLTRDNSSGKYIELKTLFQASHDFSLDSSYEYSGTYTPVPVLPAGIYYLQLEITAPNGFTERSPLEIIYYAQSGFNASVGKVTGEGSTEPERWLIPGESNFIPVSLQNSPSFNDYHVIDDTLKYYRLASNTSVRSVKV